MAELTPARLVTPAHIIREECAERVAIYTALLIDGGLMQRAETGTMTDEDCQYVAKRFGTSVALWRNLNKSAAAWIAEHKEAA